MLEFNSAEIVFEEMKNGITSTQRELGWRTSKVNNNNNNNMTSYIARQLGNPTGWFGRFILSRIFFTQHNTEAAKWSLEGLILGEHSIPSVIPQDDQGDSVVRLLEIGFGGGQGLGIMAQMLQSDKLNLDSKWHISGWDISEDMLAEATRRNRKWIGTGHMELQVKNISDFSSLRQQSGAHRFNLVFAQNVVYFWTDPVAELRKLGEVANHVAIVVVDDDGQDRRRRVMSRFPGPVKTASQVQEAMQEAGLHSVASYHNEHLGCVLIVGHSHDPL